MLPQEFTARMKEMLGEEYPQFIGSLEKKNYRSLRFNTLKGSREEFLSRSPFHLSPVPWEENGFYYEEEDQPGKHPLHEAGAYYIQEASAMLPVTWLKALPGERVLDLCAAPGGKSTQIAAGMKGEGILVCNEIHPARAAVLSGNVERMGIGNAIVTSEPPRKLSEHFPRYFDRILVDAPCSGEGMFRKNPLACEEWSPESVRLCAERQDAILDAAAAMLRPGGRLVYSTCTFAPEENEGSLSRFISRHPEFSVAGGEKLPGMGDGIPEWTQTPAPGLSRAVRLWPHRIGGEGHFAAALVKEEETGGSERRGRAPEERGVSEKECPEYTDFRKRYIKKELSGILLRRGDQLYLAPEGTPSLRRLKVLRPGLHLGTVKKDRLEPAHALAMFLAPGEVKYTLPLEGEEVYAWLGGQTLKKEGEKGYYLMETGGYGLGWGKLSGGVMKNHYPRGLRKSC